MRILSLYIAVLTLIASGQTTATQFSPSNCETDWNFFAHINDNNQVCFPDEDEESGARTCSKRFFRDYSPSLGAELKTKQPNAIISEANKNLFRIYVEVGAGKGCELLLAQDFGVDKATAKALGKICKYVQAKKPAFDVVMSALTTFGAFKIAEKLVEEMTLPMAVAVFVGAKSVEFYSHPRALETLKPGKTSELQLAADYWAIRPVLKTLVTGLRYTEEKIIQRCYTDAFPAIAFVLFKYSVISTKTAVALGKGGSIGSSKVVSGIIAETILSTARMHIDGDFSFGKLCKDVVAGAALSIAMGVLIPTTFVISTPQMVVFVFVIYTAGRMGVAILS